MLSAFQDMPAAYAQAHLRLDFIMEAITMNLDQTAPKEQSDLGLNCLTYRLPKTLIEENALTCDWRD